MQTNEDLMKFEKYWEEWKDYFYMNVEKDEAEKIWDAAIERVGGNSSNCQCRNLTCVLEKIVAYAESASPEYIKRVAEKGIECYGWVRPDHTEEVS